MFAAALSIALARRCPARLADLAGDQPGILGLSPEPVDGLGSWLADGALAPPEALDELALDVRPGLTLLPFGVVPYEAPFPPPEAGAALAVALRDGPETVADLGLAQDPITEVVAEMADVSVVVVRSCYLALRRAVCRRLTARAAGVVVVEEGGRALGHQAVAELIGCPVLARVPIRASVARAIDAGNLASRLPSSLATPAGRVLDALGFGVTGRAA